MMIMARMATDRQIPTAMAPPEDGVCDRCGLKSDICGVYYPRTDPEKSNSRDLCSPCRKACGQGTRWKYAGGGDVVEMSPLKKTASDR
jgi:hypothetical protein